MTENWTPFQLCQPITRAEAEELARKHADQAAWLRQPLSDQELDTVVNQLVDCVIYKNNLYQVSVYDKVQSIGGFPELIHLSIKSIDKQPIRDWRHLQRIKNEIVGEEHEAVELYPAESRKVDLANQFHLWVLKDAELRFPFGFIDRATSDSEGHGSRQRSGA